MKTISIITNKKVDKTFEGVECLLRRTINKLAKVNEIRRYSIVTDRCNYVETSTPITEQVEILDADNNPTGNFETEAVLNELGEPTFNVVTNLVSFGIKDKETVKSYNDVQVDAIYEEIKDLVSFDYGYTNFVMQVEQYGLLIGTQKDLAWGTVSEDWEILNQ